MTCGSIFPSIKMRGKQNAQAQGWLGAPCLLAGYVLTGDGAMPLWGRADVRDPRSAALKNRIFIQRIPLLGAPSGGTSCTTAPLRARGLPVNHLLGRDGSTTATGHLEGLGELFQRLHPRFVGWGQGLLGFEPSKPVFAGPKPSPHPQLAVTHEAWLCSVRRNRNVLGAKAHEVLS